MNDHDLLDRLLADVQEEFDFDGVLPLYMFAWSLAGLGMARGDENFPSTCRAAYDAFRSASPDLVLAWVPWPIGLAEATPADDDVPIDLDLDPDSESGTQLLALVRPTDLPPQGVSPTARS